MDKKTVFVNAMKYGKYKMLPWVISAFSLIKTDVNSIKEIPYNLYYDPTGYSYYDEDKQQLVKIRNGSPSEPLYNSKEEITISSNDISNLNEVVTTTYGRLLFNWLCLVGPFGNKIPYMNSYIDLNKVENIIKSRLADDPKDDSDRNETDIYVSEYLEYTKAVRHLVGFSQLFSQGVTRKSLLPPPGVNEFKNKLLEEHKDSLTDMATIAVIDKKLIEYDAEYLKNDPSEDFLISGKSRNVVRKKMFLMLGAEEGLDNNKVHADVVTNSLEQGWDIAKFPAINNTYRAGSFNRGAETELGGSAVKMLLRASSNINIIKGDCGSKVGTPMLIDDFNKERLVGFSVIDKGTLIKISSLSDAETMVGKQILLRNPMYCKCEYTDYCEVCVGDRLNVNPTGISSSIASYGDVMLGIFMKAMHGSTLELAKMDFNRAII